MLSLSGKKWLWPTAASTTALAATKHGVPGWITDIAIARGLAREADLPRFLQPSLQDLADPGMMADMEIAVQRIAQAIAAKERLVIYGDYDVDGVSSAAVMLSFLRQLQADVAFYIPDRKSEGYGLNAAAMQKLAAEYHLIITVDCGISALAEIALAKAHGADVIVVDHHQVGEQLPAAVAVLNPHRPDCRFAFKDLCAAGVAFMLCVALRRHLRTQGHFTAAEPDLRELLDLVAVATVADMVPMHGLNRILVACGLKQMARNPRPGYAALCQVAGIKPAQVTASDCGFRLGPRLNARGRLHHAGMAVDLLLAESHSQALSLAAQLEEANQNRRTLEQDTLGEALAQVAAANWQDDGVMVVQNANWHPGILGLVASRLVARYHKPTLVIGEGGKGSGRSIPGFNLYQALCAVKGHLQKFGGHPAAAGVTVDTEDLNPLRSALHNEAVQQLGEPPYIAELRLDATVGCETLQPLTVQQLNCLAPFGQGHSEPLLGLRRLQVTEARVLKERHLKLRLNGFDAIGFDMAALHAHLPSHVDAAVHLEENVYQNQARLQLRLRDLQKAA